MIWVFFFAGKEDKTEVKTEVEEVSTSGNSHQDEEKAQTPASQLPDDDDETCGFCKFMKGGGCREAFNNWSKCVDREKDTGSDYTEECRDTTLALRECMLAHKDYYAPLLEEEEAMLREQQEEQEAADELAREQESGSSSKKEDKEGGTQSEQQEK
jgi:mitochondrial intermembrane space import and assembly protein 40